MRTITNIGSHSVQDHELGPQIDWERLVQCLRSAGIAKTDFCSAIHVWLPDLNRYIRNKGVDASARTRLRVAYYVRACNLDPDIVSEGKQPPQSKVG